MQITFHVIWELEREAPSAPHPHLNPAEFWIHLQVNFNVVISLGGPHLTPSITPPAAALAESWAGSEEAWCSSRFLRPSLRRSWQEVPDRGSRAWRPKRRAARTVPSAPWVGSAVGLESEGLSATHPGPGRALGRGTPAR